MMVEEAPTLEGPPPSTIMHVVPVRPSGHTHLTLRR
jgi:hypothetical protein